MDDVVVVVVLAWSKRGRKCEQDHSRAAGIAFFPSHIIVIIIISQSAAAQHGRIKWPAARARNESEQHIQPEQGRHRRRGQDGVRAVQALASVIIIIVSKRRSAGRSRSRYETSSFCLALPLLLLVSVSAEQSRVSGPIVSSCPVLPGLNLCIIGGCHSTATKRTRFCGQKTRGRSRSAL